MMLICKMGLPTRKTAESAKTCRLKKKRMVIVRYERFDSLRSAMKDTKYRWKFSLF